MERLRPDIVIHRLSGERESSSLIAPKWSLHKGSVQMAIEEEFEMTIDDDELVPDHFRSVGNLITFVVERL